MFASWDRQVSHKIRPVPTRQIFVKKGLTKKEGDNSKKTKQMELDRENGYA